MARTANIGIRVEPDLKDAADRAAADDHRSVASLVEKLLTEYLEREGYLKRTTTPRGGSSARSRKAKAAPAYVLREAAA
jgi:hypothetical protein